MNPTESLVAGIVIGSTGAPLVLAAGKALMQFRRQQRALAKSVDAAVAGARLGGSTTASRTDVPGPQ